MWPQEETEERLSKHKVYYTHGSRDRRQGTPCRTTWERLQNGQEAEGRSEGTAQAKTFIGIFSGKARQSRANCLGLASLNNLGRLGAIGCPLVT